MKIKTSIFFVLICWITQTTLLSAQNHTTSENVQAYDQLNTPEDVVKEIYQLVTFEAGHLPDWDKVHALFVEDALIVLRTSSTEHTVFSTEEFVTDFKNFIQRSRVDTTGFTEEVINVQTTTFGDISHCIVIYEASIPGSDRPPQKGVDSFQLIRKNDHWQIVSIVNEIPTGERKIPKKLYKY